MAVALARRVGKAVSRQADSRPARFASTEEAELRHAIEKAWADCKIAVAENDKSRLRDLHLRAKLADRSVEYHELERQFDRLRTYFPNPTRIEPSRIDPCVIPVRERTVEEQLFKITRGYWSMPYSKGYGRRLRFVVMDRYHQALIGIIGLQSPSADLGCRDRFLGVSSERKLSVVNNTMDAYTVGATPSYAPLLGGKLVAGYLCSPVIRREYWKVYGNKITTQLRKRIPQPLLAITTASAFGRSSIYNRLRTQDRLLARPLGYTRGFGTLHLEAIYPKMVEWLKASGKHVPAGFGNGPKVRWQNIMHTLVGLKIPTKYLEHGLQREVFIVELVSNLLEVCQSGATPNPIAFDDRDWASYWLGRWCLPRVSRQPDWHEFHSSEALRQALRAGQR